MKNYFKKFSIMFVMLLAVIGFGIIQNGTVANAATIGQQLTSPEAGWQRFENDNSKIIFTGNGVVDFKTGQGTSYSGGSCTYTQGDTNAKGCKIEFKFHGTKLRLIALMYSNKYRYSDNIQITIDGIARKPFSEYGNCFGALVYEIEGFELGTHSVLITNIDNYALNLDAIDIDDTGYLVDPKQSISLDKSTMDLAEGNSKQLTATTTPAGLDVTLTSSDTSIATVDSTGKVTAVKEGTCTITATTADGLTATCTVTVTKASEPQPPVNGDANIFIELVDGQIKSYSVSSDEITKFKQWYIDRDSTKSNKPYYEFSKGSYKDFVIHDKIDWFEVR